MAQSRFSAFLQNVRLFFTGRAGLRSTVGHQVTVQTIDIEQVAHQFEVGGTTTDSIGHQWSLDSFTDTGRLFHQFNVDHIDDNTSIGHQFDIDGIKTDDSIGHQFDVFIVSHLGHQYTVTIVSRLGHQFYVAVTGVALSNIPTLLRFRQEGHNSAGKLIRFYNGAGSLKAEYLPVSRNINLGVKTGNLLIDTKSDASYSITSTALSSKSITVYRPEKKNQAGRWALLDEEGE